MSVAIVDAYDDRNADIRPRHLPGHLQPAACTTANGRFRKFNESGQASPLPRTDTGWAGEISWTSRPQRRHQPQQRHLRRSTVHR